MTTAEYRAHPALNYSLAKHLLKSPAHFKCAMDEEREVSEAMHVGTLVHAMVIEGKNMLDLYAVKPKGMSFATKDGKAWRDEQTLPILSDDSAQMIPRIADAVAANPHASLVINRCKQYRELPIIKSMMHVKCKALLDMAGVYKGQWGIADLKTCRDASPKAFARDVAQMDYDLQAAWYSTLLANARRLRKPPTFIWIAVEKTAPFASAVYTSEEWYESGMRKLERVLDIYKGCVQFNNWPMPYRGINKLERPEWA